VPHGERLGVLGSRPASPPRPPCSVSGPPERSGHAARRRPMAALRASPPRRCCRVEADDLAAVVDREHAARRASDSIAFRPVECQKSVPQVSGRVISRAMVRRRVLSSFGGADGLVVRLPGASSGTGTGLRPAPTCASSGCERPGGGWRRGRRSPRSPSRPGSPTRATSPAGSVGPTGSPARLATRRERPGLTRRTGQADGWQVVLSVWRSRLRAANRTMKTPLAAPPPRLPVEQRPSWRFQDRCWSWVRGETTRPAGGRGSGTCGSAEGLPAVAADLAGATRPSETIPASVMLSWEPLTGLHTWRCCGT
jgi:hypothetical protein